MITAMQIVNFIRTESLNHGQFQSFCGTSIQSLLICHAIQKCVDPIGDKYSVGGLNSTKKFVSSGKAKEKTQQCYRAKKGNVS